MKTRHSSVLATAFVFAVCWGIVWIWVGRAFAQEGEWPITVAERSDFRATSRSEQVVEFIDRVVERAPHVRRMDFGRTGEGRPLVAAIVAQPPLASPLKPADDRRLVVLLLGNIHAGECDGKEALLMLLRDLAQQPAHPWLKDLVLVFVPNFNPDGNDRMRKDNRPGQVGPEEGMGQRANAQDLDLNRDFTKLETPECQQLVALMNQWDPHLLIDTHTTNGSRHRYVLTYDAPHNPAAPAQPRELLRQEILPEVTRRLATQQIAVFYYGNFNREYTQWITYGDEPRYGIEYFGLRGRLAILAESYSYATYQQRIVAVREFVRECLNSSATRAPVIRQLLDDVRQQAVAAASAPAIGTSVPIQSEMVASGEKVVIQGYKRTTDASGRRVSTSEPCDYTVNFLTDFRPTVAVASPYAYVLPTGAAALADRLRRHGVQLQRLTQDIELDIEYYRIQSLGRAKGTYQGHVANRATVELHTDRRTVPQGSCVVTLAQPLSVLIVQLLEPHAIDGFLAWDLFEPALTSGSEYPVWRLPQAITLPVVDDERGEDDQ